MASNALSVGFVPIVRKTFDVPLAEAVTAQARATLTQAGLTLVEPDAPLSTLEEAVTAASSLAAKPMDALVVFQATFADSTMVMALAEKIAVPLVLWAIPEERTGGRLRLNSFCGINLGGHALTRAGYTFTYAYKNPDDTAILDVVLPQAKAGYVMRKLRETRIGRVGENPEGFDSCLVDWEGLSKRFGVEIDQLTLDTVFEQVRATDPAKVDKVLESLESAIVNLNEMDRPALRGTVGTYITLKTMAQEKDYAGLAVRCWPNFFTELGCAACGALSMLNNDLVPAACETDINGTVTQLMLQWLSGEAVFGTDIVAFDEDLDAAVLWHCGKAPLAMCDPDFEPRAVVHSNRKLPLLFEFPLKPGKVTVARLSEATGEFRLVVGTAEVLASEPSFSGTSGVVKFDHPIMDVLDTIMTEGLEHHVAITYGDHLEPLLVLADYLEIPVLHL